MTPSEALHPNPLSLKETHMHEPNPRSELIRRLEATALIILLLAPTRAHASIFGEENGPLVTLVAEGAEQLVQFGQQLQTLKQTYDQVKGAYDTAKKVAGMAQDAVNGFNEFKQFAETVTTAPDRALYSVFPDAMTLRNDLSSPQSWAQGTGELQRLIRVCLEGGGSCAEFHQAVTARMAKDAISGTFGTVPPKHSDIETIDVEAADGISKATAANAAAALSEKQAHALRTKCQSGTDSEAIAACQMAGALGSLMTAEQLAIMNQQMAEANRLHALGLAEKNEEAKLRYMEQQQRGEALKAGAQLMAPPQVTFTPIAPGNL